MLTTENAVINFSVIALWVFGSPTVSAKQSSEIYCGGILCGSMCLDFIFHCVSFV